MQFLVEEWATAEEEIPTSQDNWLHPYVFGSIDSSLQKKLSQNTSTHLRRGSTALKFVVNKVTEVDRE